MSESQKPSDHDSEFIQLQQRVDIFLKAFNKHSDQTIEYANRIRKLEQYAFAAKILLGILLPLIAVVVLPIGVALWKLAVSLPSGLAP